MTFDISSWLTNLKSKYLEAHNLIEDESEQAKEKNSNQGFEPYKKKYAGRKILEELLTEVENRYQNAYNSESKDENLCRRFKVIEALFHYELGRVSCEVEETSTGADHYNKALELIKNRENDRDCCPLVIDIKNQLGILWSDRGEPDKARSYLGEAEQLYFDYAESKLDPPIPRLKLFCYPDDNEFVENGFGKAYVHTIYYLAQVYERLDDAKLAAVYCHKTLKWQMDSKDYNPLEWALNCATLSQFFVSREKFPIARHLLSCASYVLETVQPKKSSISENSVVLPEKRTRADVARCWSNYGIALLSASRDRLAEENKEDESGGEKLIDFLKNECKLDEYALIPPDEVEQFRGQMSDSYFTTYEDAKTVFLATQQWIKESKSFYTLNDYASDHAQIVQMTSKLYDHLSAFETENERKCKMQKRRIDMLEELLKALSRVYYLDVCRQIMFELGEIYTRMIHLKLAVYQPRKKDAAHAVTKINLLVEKGIAVFRSFLDSVGNKDEPPERYPDTLVRPAMLARFYIGQLYSKFIVLADPERRTSNLKEIENNYLYVEDYVKRNADQESCIAAELAVFKEMVDLIPGRLQQEMSSTLY